MCRCLGKLEGWAKEDEKDAVGIVDDEGCRVVQDWVSWHSRSIRIRRERIMRKVSKWSRRFRFN